MNFNEVGLSLGHLLNLLELTSAIPGNFDQNMFTENGFSTFLPKKKVPVASHFSQPKYRRFGPKRASYIWIIGAFVSYIGFIGNIGGLPGLTLTFNTLCYP